MVVVVEVFEGLVSEVGVVEPVLGVVVGAVEPLGWAEVGVLGWVGVGAGDCGVGWGAEVGAG